MPTPQKAKYASASPEVHHENCPQIIQAIPARPSRCVALRKTRLVQSTGRGAVCCSVLFKSMPLAGMVGDCDLPNSRALLGTLVDPVGSRLPGGRRILADRTAS